MIQQILNRTIFTKDNLEILRGLNCASMDLIYLDPPFNSNRHYSAPVGSKAAGAAFKDAWTFEDTDDAWHGEIADKHPSLYKVIDAAGSTGGIGTKAYLIYMAMRLVEMHRVMKQTATLYLHCDPTMSHSLKMVMDAVFGNENFRNEIVWHYNTGGASKRKFAKKHDILLFYSKSEDYRFNTQREAYREEKTDHFLHIDEQGRQYRVRKMKNGQEYFYYKDQGRICHDVWDIDSLNAAAKERQHFPTQKPLSLLRRIIEASSNKGDMVLDPFCGCATTCVATEMLERQWIGIDLSDKTIDLVKERLRNELTIGDEQNPMLIYNVIHRTDIPKRTDHGAIKPSKDIKHILFGKQQGRCNGCLYDFPFQNFTLDHIVPQSKGGSHTNDNLQLLCNYCNSKKGNRTTEELITELKRTKMR